MSADGLSFWVTSAPVQVFLRTVLFTGFWCVVRILFSLTLFRSDGPEKVVKGSKAASALHAALMFPAALWVAGYDPVMSPHMRLLWDFSPGEVDLVTLHSPNVCFLATVAAGEFGMQMVHWRAWYKKPGDMLMVGHHVISLILWPLTHVARRHGFFIAIFLLYEASCAAPHAGRAA